MIEYFERFVGTCAVGIVLGLVGCGLLRVLEWRHLARVRCPRLQAHYDYLLRQRILDTITLASLDVAYRVALANPGMDPADAALVARRMLLSDSPQALPTQIGVTAQTYGVSIEDALADCLTGFVQRRDLDLGVTGEL